jgi:hypothetical protein
VRGAFLFACTVSPFKGQKCVRSLTAYLQRSYNLSSMSAHNPPPRLNPIGNLPLARDRIFRTTHWDRCSQIMDCPCCDEEARLTHRLIRTATLRTRYQCPRCGTLSRLTQKKTKKVYLIIRYIIPFIMTMGVIADCYFNEMKFFCFYLLFWNPLSHLVRLEKKHIPMNYQLTEVISPPTNR